MAVTAMLGPVLAVVLRVAPARTAFAPFADPIIFLFIGSFILAEAMFVHGVDRRIAYTALSWRFVGTSGARILIVYGARDDGCISMWISNTATTAMMFPIGLSIVAHLARSRARAAGRARQFALAMMLITSFGASIGGMGTPVGTPPNLIGIGMLERITGTCTSSFFQWMVIGVPLVMLVLFAFLAVLFTLHVRARRARSVRGRRRLVRDELQQARARCRAASATCCVAFGVTVLLWIAPGISRARRHRTTRRSPRAYQRRCPRASRRWSARCCCSCCRSTGGRGASR